MTLFKNIDKKFEEIGFIKIREDKYGVEYERYNKEFDYIQKLYILYKSNKEPIIQSAVGLTEYELKLVLKKIRRLKKTTNR